MIASGEIRLSTTTMRQMPVLAQSPDQTQSQAVVNNWLTGNYGNDPATSQTLTPNPALTDPNYFGGQSNAGDLVGADAAQSPGMSRMNNPYLQSNIGTYALAAGAITAAVGVYLLASPESEIGTVGSVITNGGTVVRTLATPGAAFGAFMGTLSQFGDTGLIILHSFPLGALIGTGFGYYITPPAPGAFH